MSQTESSTPNAAADPIAEIYWREDNEDRRSLRLSLALAFVVHLLILFTAIPELKSEEAEPPPPKKVIKLAEIKKYSKPPPPPVDPPQRRELTREIPMPADDPDNDVFVPDIPEPTVEFEAIGDEPLMPLPTAPPEAAPTGPIRVGGQISPPTRTHYVAPRYPEIARRARIEGTVILEATIDTEGRVVDLKVLKNLPLGLTKAATEAATKWRFEPSTLNGKPVPVLYVITAHFRLNG